MNELALLKRIEALEKLTLDKRIEVGKPFIDDLRFPAIPGLFNPVTAKPDYDYTNLGFLFDASASEHVYIIAQMPHDWVIGTSITPHVHWEPTNTNTGDVRWVIDYKWTNIDAVEAVSATTIAINATAAGTAYTHQQSYFADIAGTGKTVSSILSIDLWRYGGYVGDTYNVDALLKEFDIHYYKDPSKSYWTG